MDILAKRASLMSRRVNWFVERFCVGLMILLVLDVWLGVLVRYLLPLDWTFMEELARYLMIWMALLAVSSGIAHREHIGVLVLFERFPPQMRKWLAVLFDLVAFAFFFLVFFYGIGFVERGFGRYTMIAQIPKGWPFMGVPIAAIFACCQLMLVAIHDFIASDGVAAADRVEI
ncbi:TRAP transporter small permease subunit [uncultured Cohaesibacter sp.]|uniref:TRAP transporter small permease n=1 Tax=uncultured Cohaesibacter sp. TaxID=1002546 RepID=UPI0029C893F3|nr:TRAP transporter small permease subunit [uncultured Cohaesibacter sp.]